MHKRNSVIKTVIINGKPIYYNEELIQIISTDIFEKECSPLNHIAITVAPKNLNDDSLNALINFVAETRFISPEHVTINYTITDTNLFIDESLTFPAPCADMNILGIKVIYEKDMFGNDKFYLNTSNGVIQLKNKLGYLTEPDIFQAVLDYLIDKKQIAMSGTRS